MTFKLSDYPVLARIAAGRTRATRLDDRACRWLYTQATPADLRAMSPDECSFRDLPMENMPACQMSRKLEALRAQVTADGFRHLPDEKAFMDDQSGDI